MGIQGLLPFLKKSSRICNLAEFKGKTVAVDAYCWLHKGAFSCAEKLVKGEPTDGYVQYVMKQVNMLLSFNIKPILVFDGCHLPSKSGTEKKRRENRAKNRQKAKELLREGKIKEARECFQRCVDVTPVMARDVIKACRSKNIDTIVAPYEADAQLAFLSQSGIADIIITEDSDLVMFGCSKILFKVDSNGGGILIEKENLHMSMNVPRDRFSFEKFRNMCVLSGCDYLPSLHGIGLAKACKFFNVTSNPDVFNALMKLPSHLKMPNLQVSLEYREGFLCAVNTILYQLVFDPLTKTLRPLTPYPTNVDYSDMPYCGEFIGHEKALQIALGNVDIQTFNLVDDYNPKEKQITAVGKSFGWHSKIESSTYRGIWQSDYLSLKESQHCLKERKESKERKMVGKEQCVVFNISKRKRPETDSQVEEDVVFDNYLANLYTENCSKKIKNDNESENLVEENNVAKSEMQKLPNNSLEDVVQTEIEKTSSDEKELTHATSTDCRNEQKIRINPFAKKKSPSVTKIVRSRYFVFTKKSDTSTEIEKPSSDHRNSDQNLDKILSVEDKNLERNFNSNPLHEKNAVSSVGPVIRNILSLPVDNDVDNECSEGIDTDDCSMTISVESSHSVVPSIFDTPPPSQNKENLSLFFSKFKNSSGTKIPPSPVHYSAGKTLTTSSTADRSMIQAVRSHQVFSTPKSSPSQMSRKSLSNEASNKCRVSGLRKSTPSSKTKQLNLKDMFGFNKDVMAYKV